MMLFIVTLIGVLLIAFIVWWFWLSQPRSYTAKIDDVIKIKVKDGVYQPDIIQVPINREITLRFIREDATPCAEMVIFNKLDINRALKLKQKTDIKLTIKEPGEYEFTCQMGMYRGRLIVQ